MQKIRLTITIYIISLTIYSQVKKDYTEYHTIINKAEIFFLKENNVDSCMYYYDKAFSDFDFIFVKDAMNAAQIAYYSKKDYKKYLIKGFDFGLKLDHLRWIRLFEPDLKKILIDKELNNELKKRRQQYLSKLDLNYLNTIYKYGFQDQFEKWNPDRKEYERKRDWTFLTIEKLIREKGFPGERLVGIQDSAVFKNSNSNFKDVKYWKEKYKLDYFKETNKSLSQDLMSLVIYHNFCAYEQLEDIWINQIKVGNIHPRTVALFHDNMYRSIACNKPKIPFINNLFTTYSEEQKKNLKQVNEQRAKFFMIPIEIDVLKDDYEKKYGFKLNWGFMSEL